MSGFRKALVASALTLSLALAVPPLAGADDAAPAARGQGWGPGMMGGPGYGYGPLMGNGWGQGGGAQPGWGPGMMGYGGGYGMGPGMMMGGMMGFYGGDGAEQFVEGRLAFLKTELKITDQQAAQWDAFAAAVRTNAKTINERIQPFYSQAWQKMTLPERLDQQEKVLAARLDGFQRVSAAVKPLYTALDDTQKKVADYLLLGPMAQFHGMM